MSDIFEQLSSPFDPSEVDWRVGSVTKKDTPNPEGMALAYIDARTVMDRLDTVCGPAGWQCKYVMEGAKTVCEIGIKCGDEWVWKADGAGDSDVEAEKGALSDAFKRAAVRWGVGRYLYNLKSPWVAIKPNGKSFVIAKEAQSQLDALLRGNRPTPRAEDTGSQKASKFVSDAVKEIGKLTDEAGLAAWLEAAGPSGMKNSALLARLREAYPDLAKQVEGARDGQRASFGKRSAAE